MQCKLQGVASYRLYMGAVESDSPHFVTDKRLQLE